MNKQTLLESIREHHSNLPTRQLEIYIETIANKIAIDTNVVKKTFVYSSVAGQRWYTLSTAGPNYVIKVEKVYFNDVIIPKLIGEPIIDDDEFSTPEDTSDTALTTPVSNVSNKRMWMLNDYMHSDLHTASRMKLGIVEKVTNAVTIDGRTSNYQSCSITGTSNIRMYAIVTPNPFLQGATSGYSSPGYTSLSGPLADIPVQFHDVLLNGSIAMGYKNPKNFNGDMYTFFNSQFLEGIKDIKKFVRTKHSTGFIKPQDF
jgi:hypothetical protein|tara:strand:+ start:56 stop:832 length:777 start_codon:yes stop_codon:yes gene_type:complete